ncbi:Glyoxalase/Bleomycin resistance protein/Dioxygenase superfamily protein [Natronoarchaeum philippinense]|uniref:Glyoxalase/Bleomycin resistance protein/Dioxygenase superfamily protein n=1 Tax=Natronoarchaeum philippinense TaxID=558529 RepID=A0A285NAC5_NATPI|nr:VOC family protein [Natronoarchaeum philippinense]SNZ05867.1 Glyoxalase/Bleomycin resistance protein/Dioxygenase superfamily protein [Natronoarchaeum philippinense]
MLTALSHLALEAKHLAPVREFYEDTLDLDVVDERDEEVTFAAGESRLVVRRPSGVPRGGLHTHFAFSIPDAEYDDWWDRLAATHELEEHTFGSASSLYCYDPAGNCVELGQSEVEGPGIDGIFEVVLEVADLDRALEFYEALGFSVVDLGTDRRRVRLSGPVDLELWEPQLGLADARGGVHVDLGFTASDVDAAVEAVADRACRVQRRGEVGVVRDPDGHVVTITPERDR